MSFELASNLELSLGEQPAYWLLLLILPFIWYFSFRSMAGLGNFRRIVAIGLRSFVILLIVAALAEVQLRRVSDRVTVLYLLDQSESIPLPKRQLMLRYVIQEVAEDRDERRRDRAGIIVFGREATIEVPPFDDDIPNIGRIESYIERTDATNLEAALKLAQASFPEDTARRIVIVTDGNENLGDARSVAPLLAGNGIGIDVVPVRMTTRAEIAVEKITLPADIRRGQPIEARVVLSNFMEDDSPDARPVRGTLRIVRRAGREEELLELGPGVEEVPVVLPPGKTVLSFRHTIEDPAMYTYRAIFDPDDPNDDLMSQNNEATTFTHVRGRGRVLVIEDADHPGEFRYLLSRLRAMDIEIDTQGTNELFTSLAELQGYDCVILANVPRSSGSGLQTVTGFSDAQIQMLVRNTEQMGCGLIMLGGPNSFGAGGWTNTELEKAMPVDFQIRNAQIQAVGALVLMMHASEMAQGNHWQKVVAEESIEALGEMDYCGLLHWDNFGGDSWLWGGQQGLIRVQGQRQNMLAQLSRMAPGDMPQFEPSMRLALAGFGRVNASVKHMIIISDGDPSPPLPSTIQSFVNQGIKISTVAVGTHGPAGSTPLQNIATATGGEYYVVTNPRALPRIYQREARRVARPLVKDLDNVRPNLIYPHEMLQGIEGPFPPIKGMVLTTKKDNPLVEVALLSPVPDDDLNATILAAWQYGLGRTVAFTTDAGHRWADDWTEWESYDKFFSQMVRWAMRPVNEEGKFSVATDVRDGRVRVVIMALDKDDNFLNFLDLQATAIGPDLDPFEVRVRQEAAGRYVAEFPADSDGSYHLTISPGPGRAPIMAGVTVPYSEEFRDRETNLALLEDLARVRPAGGNPGQVLEGDISPDGLGELMQVNTFRHDLPRAFSSQDVWPLLLMICAAVFFADVLVRRVSFGYEWVAPMMARIRQYLGREETATEREERLERLRNQKAQVAHEIDQRRAATRFEPEPDTAPPPSPDEVLGPTPSRKAAKPKGRSEPLAPEEETSYTSRLLEAKRRAWKEKEK